jgi:hypothetical protein
MFTRETRVPTTPTHQQATDETVTCLSTNGAKSVTMRRRGPRRVLAGQR